MVARRHQSLPVVPTATILIGVLLLCSLPAAYMEEHDAEAPKYKILTVIATGGSSHTFDLVAVAGVLAKR